VTGSLAALEWQWVGASGPALSLGEGQRGTGRAGVRRPGGWPADTFGASPLVPELSEGVM